jgi:phosphopantothenoylcysteine decarboxylase / phosphopantothenate---cysteine ligase
MLNEVKKALPVDIAICVAAVSDFKPSLKNKKKIKKDNINVKSINFVKNNDILEYIAKNNKHRPRLVAGFSAETGNLIKNSIIKMKKKHCDLIFANDVSQNNFGFNSDYNEVSVIDKKGKIKIIPKNKKSFIAKKIAEILVDKLIIDDRNIN